MGCGARMTMATAVLTLLLLAFAFAALPTHARRINPKNVDVDHFEAQRSNDKKLFDVFQRWMEKHGREYHSRSEMQKRFRIFKDNVYHIQSHNGQQSDNSDYWMGLNSFSDLTHAEFRSHYLGGYKQAAPSSIGFPQLQRSEENFIYTDVVAEPAVDWRARGAVSLVKDQGQCGACWAFSAIGAIEALRWYWTGEMLTLSEKELFDCDSPPNSGCGGGFMEAAFDYIHKNGGIHIEEAYPYMPYQSQCLVQKMNSSKVAIDGYENVPSNSETSLLKTVSMHPVSVAIEGTACDFQHYQGGVFTGSCGTRLDHAVLLVGYGTDGDTGKDYWIVKNSWGSSWGEQGFMRIERLGSSNPWGKCGINMNPSFPVKYWPNL